MRACDCMNAWDCIYMAFVCGWDAISFEFSRSMTGNHMTSTIRLHSTKNQNSSIICYYWLKFRLKSLICFVFWLWNWCAVIEWILIFCIWINYWLMKTIIMKHGDKTWQYNNFTIDKTDTSKTIVFRLNCIHNRVCWVPSHLKLFSVYKQFQVEQLISSEFKTITIFSKYNHVFILRITLTFCVFIARMYRHLNDCYQTW